jgi:hypothetical protein
MELWDYLIIPELVSTYRYIRLENTYNKNRQVLPSISLIALVYDINPDLLLFILSPNLRPLYKCMIPNSAEQPSTLLT